MCGTGKEKKSPANLNSGESQSDSKVFHKKALANSHAGTASSISGKKVTIRPRGTFEPQFNGKYWKFNANCSRFKNSFHQYSDKHSRKMPLIMC